MNWYRKRREVVVTDAVSATIGRLENLTDRIGESAAALEEIVHRLKEEADEEDGHGVRTGGSDTEAE